MNRTTFSPQRLWLLIKRDISIGYRGTLIAAAAVGGFILLFSVLSAINNRGDDYYYGMYAALLFVGGYITTSLAFREVHREESGTFYLTLPGSALEKYLSKLLVTSIGYVLVSMAFMVITAAASEGVNYLLFRSGHSFFNPFQKEMLFAAAAYLVTQSIFLLGSIYFRKLAFIKTYLTLSVLGVGLALAAGFFAWLLFPDLFDQGRMSPGIELHLNELGGPEALKSSFLSTAKGFYTTIKVLFWGILAPMCWLIGYFRLSEAEI